MGTLVPVLSPLLVPNQGVGHYRLPDMIHTGGQRCLTPLLQPHYLLKGGGWKEITQRLKKKRAGDKA